MAPELLLCSDAADAIPLAGAERSVACCPAAATPATPAAAPAVAAAGANIGPAAAPASAAGRAACSEALPETAGAEPSRLCRAASCWVADRPPTALAAVPSPNTAPLLLCPALRPAAAPAPKSDTHFTVLPCLRCCSCSNGCSSGTPLAAGMAGTCVEVPKSWRQAWQKEWRQARLVLVKRLRPKSTHTHTHGVEAPNTPTGFQPWPCSVLREHWQCMAKQQAKLQGPCAPVPLDQYALTRGILCTPATWHWAK